MNKSIFSRKIIYFIECMKTRNVTVAARSLRVSQSALSVALQQLEGELDQPLFIRSRGRSVLSPTAAADKLFVALSEKQEAFEKVFNSIERTEAPIRIATIQYFSRKYLLPALVELDLLRAANVFHVRSAKAVEAVKQGNVDLAFVVSHSVPFRDDNYCFEIKKEIVGIVGLKKNFSYIEKVTRLDELSNEPWVVGDKIYEDWYATLKGRKNCFYVEDHFSARFLVLGGHAIAPFQLDYFTDDEIKNLSIAKIKIPSSGLRLFAILNKSISAERYKELKVIVNRVKKFAKV